MTRIFVWEGGMSFHGGFLGVVLALWLFARRCRRDWVAMTDFIAPLVPLGLGAGRLGNYINAELLGAPNGHAVCHGLSQRGQHSAPSVLALRICIRRRGALRVALVVLQQAARARRNLRLISNRLRHIPIRVEFTREPDSHLCLLALDLSMGQWLSLPGRNASRGDR